MMPDADIVALSTSEHFRSEEHTSELQSRRDLVCRLLLEKKKYLEASGLLAKNATTTANFTKSTDLPIKLIKTWTITICTMIRAVRSTTKCSPKYSRLNPA